MMNRGVCWRVLGVLSFTGGLVSLAMACGDDAEVATPVVPDGGASDGPDPGALDGAGPASAAVDAFCSNTLALYAPRFAECCDSSAAPKTYAFNHALLKALPAACTESLGKSVQSGRAELAPPSRVACETNVSEAIRARTCPDVLRTPTNQPTRSIFGEAAGCSDMLVGRQPIDAPCAADYECTNGLTCIGWSPDGDGSCKPPPGEGAACGYAIPDGGGFLELVRWGFGDHPRCAPGLHCAATALQQGTCRPSAPATGACSSSDECAEGLRCQLGVCGTEGPAPAGAPCDRSSDCQDRLYCKRVDGGSVCATREVAGAPCSGELGSDCQGACVKPDGGGPATCVAFCGSP